MVLGAGASEASVGRDTLVDTMQGSARDEVGMAMTGARRLATPTEVAVYLQVPVKTLYT
jgi:hypothetical protein